MVYCLAFRLPEQRETRDLRLLSLQGNRSYIHPFVLHYLTVFLYTTSTFGSQVRLKPREKQVPAAPQSLKANVDKLQLKYKAV